MINKKLVSILTLVLIFSCFKKSEGLRQSDIPNLINQFLAIHAEYHEFNDEISARTLQNYINILDYGKYYFYKDDIAKFQVHKYKIDDYIRNNQYSFIYEIFDKYKKRFNENMKLFNQIIESKFNFKKDEKIIVDRDKIEFAQNKSEMRNRWRKNIKLQLLNYMSSGNKIKNAKDKLKKKYKLLEKRIDELNEKKMLARFINAFSTALDPHSNYLSQEEHEDFKISMELKLEGIGVRLRSEDGFVIVESIIPGGATDKLPKSIILKPNDKIIAVSQGDDEFTDVIDMDLRDVVKKIRGRKGTEVRLKIIRETENNKTTRMIVPIIREEIKLKDSDAESDVYILKNKTPQKIGYIKLPSFYYDPARRKSSAIDLKKHIKKLKKKSIVGIVLDLRGNPGGLLNEAIEIAGLFIDKGPIVQIKDGRHPPRVINDTNSGTIYDGPIIVLINKFSASASEILAGAIKDYKRGLVIGPTNTFGKGTVQSYNPLPFEKGAFKITTHIFYQPGGTSNQLHGIEPDIIIPSMSSIWDIGEGKTKHPLQWKKIESAPFSSYGLINKGMLNILKNKSTRRVNSNKEFINLSKKIKKLKKHLNNKSISLKEESNIEKQKKKEIEKTMKKDDDDKIINVKEDIFLKEAFNVANDYIKILKMR